MHGMHGDAIGCTGMREDARDARGCERMREDARGCTGMREDARDARGCERMHGEGFRGAAPDLINLLLWSRARETQAAQRPAAPGLHP